MSEYIPSIGLEVHVELKTRTKMFCDSLNDPDEKHPNMNVCPVCMGHPGTLPVINMKAVEYVLKVGLALGATIPEQSKFDRKNYFYPDLPKGYQISQYDEPLALGGVLEIESQKSKIKIRVRRVHLEEDTGRLIHPEGADHSLVDFNRAGVPLMELVTEPDMHSAEEARAFAEELKLLFRYLGVSDADMEKGQMRLEANVSVSKFSKASEAGALGTKVEVKNLNSFRALEEAVRYEIERQIEFLEEGKKVVQDTRGWDDIKKKTVSQRSKEEAHDYRYFPEPDLPQLRIGVRGKGTRDRAIEIDLEKLRMELPELPWQKRVRFEKEYGLAPGECEILVRDPEFAEFFEQAVSEFEAHDKGHEDKEKRSDLVKLAYNYLVSDLRGAAAAHTAAESMRDLRVRPEHLAHLVVLIHQDKISSRVAKDVLVEMLKSGEDPETIVREKDLEQVSDTGELEVIVGEVVKANPKPVADYRSGKQNALQFLVGQIMARSRGKANPKVVEEILKRLLA